jgi:hypothetical protein
MKNDKLKQFVTLREQLLKDRAELEARLVEINKALGAVSGPLAAAPDAPVGAVAPVVAAVKGKPGRKKKVVLAPAAAPAPAPAKLAKAVKLAKPAKVRRGGKRAKNEMSLRDAVLAVTKSRPLARQEILVGVQNLGYVFSAKDPLNSLSTLLYTDKGIKNYGGKFGPV